MSRFLELCQYAETRRIDIDYFPLGCLETLSMPVCGANAIAIDPAKIKSAADETYKLAHELGHCEYGGFYNAKSPLDLRGKREYKADVWAVQNGSSPSISTSRKISFPLRSPTIRNARAIPLTRRRSDSRARIFTSKRFSRM